MLIVSWNVASLTTTLSRIDEDYGCLNNSDSLISKEKTSSFSYFLTHHNIDILCIQEHKIPIASLSNRCEAFKCSHTPGYESFWSCSSKKGFNGVVTFCKKGLVLSACSTPLGQSSLDDQGRCILTDHGSHVIFNVYVPVSCGHSLINKMRFLYALRKAMIFQRKERNKNVILVGDLNIAYRKEDMFWNNRLINVNKIINYASDNDSVLHEWKMQLSSHWNNISNVLKTIEAVKVTTKNITTGKSFEKYKARVRRDNNDYIFLGKPEVNEEDALLQFDFSQQTYFDEELNQNCVEREENLISISKLSELMSKIAKVNWSMDVQVSIASSEEVGVNPVSPPVRWLNQLINEDDMIDTFRYFHSKAEGRFTCWNQYTNSRYSNVGARIDYILIDRALEKKICRGSALRSGIHNHHNPMGESAALAAGTV